MEAIRHGLNGYRIPSYMEEILTHNYCPYFIRMSMVREGQSYRFAYRPGKLTRLNVRDLDTYGKLVLLRSLFTLNEAAEGYLISADNYLIEPELIYSESGSTTSDRIRLLFYPDVKRLRFRHKITQFTERIKEGAGREERELLDQFREIAEGGDLNRSKMFLDKNILRIESRTLVKAG